MIEFGWMATALILGLLAYKRVGVDVRHEKRLAALEVKFSEWPKPEELLAQMGRLEERLVVITEAGATLPQVVARANVLTQDLLKFKESFVEVREQVQVLRTGRSMRAMSGGEG